jgi:hypothetical protein
MLIHEYTYEFGNSDVSRVKLKVFAQFPNTVVTEHKLDWYA